METVSALDPYLLFNMLFYNLLAMNALFASLAWCLARPNWASVLALVVFGAIWPFVNGPLEGHTLFVISGGEGHGITTSDLLSVLAAVVVAVQVDRMMSKARHRRDRNRTS